MTAVASTVVFLGGVSYTVTQAVGHGSDVGVTYAEPAVDPGPPTLAVIGDSFSSPDPTRTSWAELVAQQTGAKLVNLARGGAGYVRASVTSFPNAATQVPASTDVVVVFGGYNDQGVHRPEDVGMAARATFTTITRMAPGAALVVVGPQWSNACPTADILRVRDIVAAEAQTAGAVWLDGLGERWFADRPYLIGPDMLHPNPAGQSFLAEQIGPHVAAVLAR